MVNHLFQHFSFLRSAGPQAGALIIVVALAVRLNFLAEQSQSDPLFFVRLVDEQTDLQDAEPWANTEFAKEWIGTPAVTSMSPPRP